MYVIVWQFTARAGCEAEFEQAYAAGGVWAQLFARAPGYHGTELWPDAEHAGTYLCIDRWESPAAWQAFSATWRSDYEALDRQLEALTSTESLVGRYQLPPR